jgi:hypothetical protein
VIEVFQQVAAADSRVKYRYRFRVRKEVLFVSLLDGANRVYQFKRKAAIASMTRRLNRL